MHDMKAVTFTLHQFVRFIGESGWQETIKGDQMASKKCFVNFVRGKGKVKEVQWIEVPELPDGSVPGEAMKEVGISANDKVVKDLLQVPANEDSSQFFLVGSELSATERDQLVQFLKDNIEVFTWTTYEKPGVSPEVIRHSLNVDPNRRPVV
ncbi:uncharacterized protein LOC131313360 [Rhododendron vialii]|uniref:uncharacterized protein LOC131313360 n=1 Tax=Rhododendron vialii TaxID=182163 RepID=UPI00265FC0E4|nr:uncharacterized protein LOC131313360 [Rhododendron vialii]